METRLIFRGQLKSGKNNMGITRSGHRYPKKEWADWRDNWVTQALAQKRKNQFGLNESLEYEVWYTPGDNRRRDLPGQMDALWHVLERSGVVVDDKWLESGLWYREPVGEAGVEVKIWLASNVRSDLIVKRRKQSGKVPYDTCSCWAGQCDECR